MSSNTERRFLQFSAGGEDYAVDLLLVKEVLTTPQVTPIPNSPDYVCGLFDLRGVVLMVIDLKKKFALQATAETNQNGTIIFDLGEMIMGVKVDTIEKVLNVSEENIKPVPEVSGNKNRHYIEGVIQIEQGLIMLINPHSLFEKNPAIKQAA